MAPIDTGIRLNELVVRPSNIDRDQRLLILHGKENKWQQVPISWEGFKPLHEYLTKYRSYLAARAEPEKENVRVLARNTDPVFLNMRGEPMTDCGVSDLFRFLQKKTGVTGKRISPHNCRRTKPSQMSLDSGVQYSLE